MKTKRTLILLIFGIVLLGLIAYITTKDSKKDEILSYQVDPKLQDLQLYWRNDSLRIFKSIQNLKLFVESKQRTLKFAMNAGMYNNQNSPIGLYIQQKHTLVKLNTSKGKGNFYTKPNGVFFITTNNTAYITKTEDFKDNGQIKFATQSGPMLVINGAIHSAFKACSSNLNIRNGVGILSDNRIVFAMSKRKVNFFDFASFFKELGCKNALYLDGFVSRTYLPEKNWTQTDGNFAVLIGVTEKNKQQEQ